MGMRYQQRTSGLPSPMSVCKSQRPRMPDARRSSCRKTQVDSQHHRVEARTNKNNRRALEFFLAMKRTAKSSAWKHPPAKRARFDVQSKGKLGVAMDLDVNNDIAETSFDQSGTSEDEDDDTESHDSEHGDETLPNLKAEEALGAVDVPDKAMRQRGPKPKGPSAEEIKAISEASELFKSNALKLQVSGNRVLRFTCSDKGASTDRRTPAFSTTKNIPHWTFGEILVRNPFCPLKPPRYRTATSSPSRRTTSHQGCNSRISFSSSNRRHPVEGGFR